MTGEELLAEQRRYYRERAPEYDDWWFRRGRYALESEAERRWFADVAEVESALARLGAHGEVLELAAGTGLWLSHVPENRFDAFWILVRRVLRPGGRVFLVDSAAGDQAHTWVGGEGELEVRRLRDGREFRIVKRRWQPLQLAARVERLGLRLELATSTHGHFLFGGGS